MTSINKILAALCLTDRSPGVFQYAAELARLHEARLYILNVLNVRDIQGVSSIESMGYNVHSEEYSRDVREERRKKLEQLFEKADLPADRIEAHVRVGHPVEEILEMIESEDIDLVVMGPKGRSNIQRLLVGSVAEKVFRHSPVTVISYREKFPDEADGAIYHW